MYWQVGIMLGDWDLQSQEAVGRTGECWALGDEGSA